MMHDAAVKIPAGWLTIDPPEGVSMIALEPEPCGDVRANIVVTMATRPPGTETVTAEFVDQYLNGAVDRLSAELDEFDLIDAWTTEAQLSHPATQRLVAHHRVNGTTAEMIQQHVWIDEVVVVVTATVPLGIDDQMTSVLHHCLDSVVPVAA
jgi:hypothetical protein